MCFAWFYQQHISLPDGYRLVIDLDLSFTTRNQIDFGDAVVNMGFIDPPIGITNRNI
jgi:hypothetical protein